MKKILVFNQAIIGGAEKEKLVEIFPQLKNSFKQRKEFWEYYYTPTKVDITLEKIQLLNDNGFGVRIYWEEIHIEL